MRKISVLRGTAYRRFPFPVASTDIAEWFPLFVDLEQAVGQQRRVVWFQTAANTDHSPNCDALDCDSHEQVANQAAAPSRVGKLEDFQPDCHSMSQVAKALGGF